MLSIYSLLRLSAWPFVIGGAAASLCYAAAGETLGFYLGPVMAVTLILPVLVAGQARLRDAMIVGGAITDAVGIAWLIAVFGPNLTFTQWLACYLVLAAYALALLALTRATAAWFATLLGVAWLTWPVWTSPFLNITLARVLTPAHPLMAINSVVNYDFWLEQPLMYRYASLGQDVPYVPPHSIWPCVIVHALIALLLLGPRAWWRARERARARIQEAAGEPTTSPPPATT
jgi:hypothetical protein